MPEVALFFVGSSPANASATTVLVVSAVALSTLRRRPAGYLPWTNAHAEKASVKRKLREFS